MKLESLLIIGAFASFVRTGTVVDENTVGVDFFPTEEGDLDAWESLGCITDHQFTFDEETTEASCPSPAGGYVKEIKRSVTQDRINLSLKCHNPLIWEMVLGLNAPIVNDTPQSPFAKKDRYVEGWINLQQRADDGADRTVMAVYGRLRIDGNPEWSATPTQPAVIFEVIYSSIASVEPKNIQEGA